MQDSSKILLEENLHELNQLPIEEATELVNARDKKHHPDGHAYGVQVVGSMEQMLHSWMWLACKAGTLRGQALDIGGARAALAKVHSGEYTKKVLTCIIQAEELATKIFIANKERGEERLSRSLRAADVKDGTPGGNTMQPQDLNDVPAAQPQQGYQAGPVNSEFALTLTMVAESLANQSRLMLQQHNNKGASDRPALFQTLQKAHMSSRIGRNSTRMHSLT
jgi:hypothetical protein